MSDLLEAALGYARSGWFVFPVEPPVLGDEETGKRPVGRLVPHGKDNATTDEQLIRSWWAQGDWNIGIACEPSRLVVLDVDIAHGKHGNESLAKIDQQLEDTLTASTGSGGIHAFYSRPADFTPGSKIGFDDGLDLISNGYVVAAPSRHYTGGTYSWARRVPIAPLPDVLRTVHRERAQASATEIGTRIPQGERNNVLASIAGSMRHRGMSEESIAAALLVENKRCDPPLPDDEIRTIARSVSRYAPTADPANGAQVRELFASEGQPQAATVSIDARDLVGEIRSRANEPAVRTPWARFDEVTGGLVPGSLTVVIGFQGSGKSSFAAQLGAHHAESGWTIYYLGEMSPRILAARIIGQRTKRPWQDVLHGKIGDDEMSAVLDRLRFRIIPRHPDPIAAIRQTIAEVRAIDARAPVMLIVDYVQLLAMTKSDMRVSNTEVIRALQALIESQELVGVILSQTSRGNSKRIREGAEDSIDLADTGAETAELERSATLQLVLSYQQKDDTRVHEVIVAITKRRFGGPTKLYFDYDGESGLWMPRDTPVQSTAEQEREEAVIEQLRIHEEGTCCGAERTPCTARMSLNTLHGGYGMSKLHKVGGNKTSLTTTLKRLERERKLTKVGGVYTLVKP